MLTLTGTGRLTREPELRQTTSGATVTTVAIASTRRGSDDDPIYVWPTPPLPSIGPRFGPHSPPSSSALRTSSPDEVWHLPRA